MGSAAGIVDVEADRRHVPGPAPRRSGGPHRARRTSGRRSPRSTRTGGQPRRTALRCRCVSRTRRTGPRERSRSSSKAGGRDRKAAALPRDQHGDSGHVDRERDDDRAPMQHELGVLAVDDRKIERERFHVRRPHAAWPAPAARPDPPGGACGTRDCARLKMIVHRSGLRLGPDGVRPRRERLAVDLDVGRQLD